MQEGRDLVIRRAYGLSVLVEVMLPQTLARHLEHVLETEMKSSLEDMALPLEAGSPVKHLSTPPSGRVSRRHRRLVLREGLSDLHRGQEADNLIRSRGLDLRL